MNLDPQTALRREILLGVDQVIIKLMNEELELQFDREKLLQAEESRYINSLWKELEELGWLIDLCADFRSSGVTTGLPERVYSRHYESQEVARKLTGADLWVAWTYWHGGGKFDEPESLPWMEDAYYLKAHTEVREVLVFEKIQ